VVSVISANVYNNFLKIILSPFPTADKDSMAQAQNWRLCLYSISMWLLVQYPVVLTVYTGNGRCCVSSSTWCGGGIQACNLFIFLNSVLDTRGPG
jgi:hypothetical protein